MSDFEAELIHHAAPTLLGRKQSNLFSLPLSLLPKCKEENFRESEDCEDAENRI